MPDDCADRRGAEPRIRVRAKIAGARSASIALLCAGLVATGLVAPAPLLVWNASASMPVGLYLVLPMADVSRGDTVLAWAPASARRLAAARGYAPLGVPLVKQAAALAGDRVCGEGAGLTINGRLSALRRARDGMGRFLPRWRGCTVLTAGTVLLLGRAADSFDGRYFGPVRQSQILGRAILLWH